MNGPSSLTVMFWDGMLRWTVPNDHLPEEDPPVSAHCAAWDEDDTEPLPIESYGPQVEPLSDFVFAVAQDYKPNSGRFRVWVRDDQELRRQLDALFPIKVARYRTDYVAATTIVYKVSRRQGALYEGAGVLAWLDAHPFRGSFGLEVWAHWSLTREAVPGFLREYARRDTYPEGIFRTEAEAEPPLGL